MLGWLEYLIRAWSIGSVIPYVFVIISLFPVRPRESVTVTKYLVRVSATSSSLEIILSSSIKVLFALALVLFKMKGFVVFQNFLLTVILEISKFL